MPDDTEPMTPTAHQKAEEIHKVARQKRYNTREICLQEQDFMENHAAIINTPTAKPDNIAPLVRLSGEYWEVIDQVIGNLTLQPGRANAVICPET